MSFAGFAFTDPACGHPDFADMDVLIAKNAASEALVKIEQLLRIVTTSQNKNVQAFTEKALKLRDMAVSLNDGLNHAF
jgi:hypothetical protein